MNQDTIQPWHALQKDFDHTLLLGNGSSIAIDKRFSYASLLSTAKELGLVTEPVHRVFDYLSTEDFELVLNLLWHTYHVNAALDIQEKVTKDAYEQVRAALVQAVRNNHAEHSVVRPHLPKISEFLRHFRFVISLNYDLVVYWAMMAANEKLGRWFKDCFVSGSFERDWREFQKPYGAPGATLVFYSHGSLILATSLAGEERKLAREDDFEDLLYRVTSEWEQGGVIPLFVSEGTSRQKLTAIRRSDYLSTVYDSVLPAARPSLVIYGWSFGDNDAHILAQLSMSNPNRIAVSVYRGDKADTQLNDRLEEVRKKISRICPGAQVLFFDAESEGCWIR